MSHAHLHKEQLQALSTHPSIIVALATALTEGPVSAFSREHTQTHRMSGFAKRTQMLSNWPLPRSVAVAGPRTAKKAAIKGASQAAFKVGALTERKRRGSWLSWSPAIVTWLLSFTGQEVTEDLG